MADKKAPSSKARKAMVNHYMQELELQVRAKVPGKGPVDSAAMEGGSINPCAHAVQSTSAPSSLPPAVDADLKLLAVKKEGTVPAEVSTVSTPAARKGKCASELKALYRSIGHSHEEKKPNCFVRIMQDKRCESRLEIPDGAASLLQATSLTMPRFIDLETSTGCSWRVELKEEDGMLVLDQLWCVFARFHGLEPGCVAEFEVVHPKLMKVIVYNQKGIEMTYKECGTAKLFMPDK